MDDLISRPMAYNVLTDYYHHNTDVQHMALADALSKVPSIEPVRHGHWVYGEDEDGVDGYRCNKCGFFVTWDYQHSHIHFIDDYLFCPHCNARMDEVE